MATPDSPTLAELDTLRPDLATAWTAAGELRRDWRVNLPAKIANEIILVSLGLGGWGVLSGFAVFVLLHESVSRFPLLVFLAALLVAAIVGLMTEYLRERIDRGAEEAPEADAPRARPALLARLPVTILMLGLFELFISAWHGASEMGRGFVVDAGLLILGDELGGRLNAPWAVAALAVLWVVEGALLSAVLGAVLTDQPALIPNRPGTPRQKFARALRPAANSALIGGCFGAFAGAAGLLLTVLLMRLVAAISLILFAPGQWLALVQHAPEVTGITAPPFKHMLFGPVQFLSELLAEQRYRPLGPLVALAALMALIGWCSKNRRAWPVGILATGLFLVMMAPLAGNIGSVLLLALFAGIVWAVPGICLGAAVPLLKGPATMPRVWGGAAFLAAAALMIVSWFAQNSALLPPLVGLAVIVAGAGVIFWRGGELRVYWPLAALVLAAYVGLFTAAQRATFHGILTELSRITAKPTPPGAKPEPTWIDRLLDLKDFRNNKAPDPLANLELGRFKFLSTQPMLVIPDRRPGSLIDELLHGTGTQSATSSPALPQLSPLPVGPTAPWGVPAPSVPARPPEETRLQIDLANANARLKDAATLRQNQALAVDAQRRALAQQIDELEAQKNSLADALAAYLKTDPQRSGAPETWPDRQAQLTLQEIGIVAHYLEARAEELQSVATPPPEKMPPAALFELSVTGSLAFWVTVGLLVGWSSRAHAPLLIGAATGRKRCFWGVGPLADYHDHVHGRLPADDRQLFERLALAFLGGPATAKWQELKKLCLDLDPAELAAIPSGKAFTISSGISSVLSNSHWNKGGHLIELAKKFLDLQKKARAGATPGGPVQALVEDWSRRAATDPQKLLIHLRAELAIPQFIPLGTFLQGVGMVEGAHFAGCFCTPDTVPPPPLPADPLKTKEDSPPSR